MCTSGGGQQSCHLVLEVCAQTEQSFVMVGKQDIFTAYLPVHTAEHLSGNVSSEFPCRLNHNVSYSFELSGR